MMSWATRSFRSSSVDIAAGESLYGYYSFANMIASDAVRVIQPDVTRVGGVTEWLQIATTRQPAGCESLHMRAT